MEAKMRDGFHGQFKRVLDNRNRLRIPNEIIQSLGLHSEQQIAITPYISCLLAFPLNYWSVIEEKIGALSKTDSAIKTFIRSAISGVVECKINRNTIVIPSDLVEMIGLRRNLIIIGQSNFFEIWDEDKWIQGVPDTHEMSKTLKSLREIFAGVI
jgi:MraZ protein